VVDVTTGVNEVVNSNGVLVYPNPSDDGLINIYHTKGKIKAIIVTDILGRIIHTENMDTDYVPLKLAQKGMYFISVYDEKNVKQSIKVLIR
jgi:hypothetical protein